MNVSAPSFLRFLACATLLCFVAEPAFAQQPTASSDYTTSLPSVAKVEAQLQGTDPIDTAARQVAVFEYLQVYIQRIRDARQYNGPYTSGELQLRTNYSKAQYDLTQAFTKSHSAEDVKKFNQLEGNYSVNNALDWIKQLEGQQAADTYAGTEASLSQSYQQHEAQLQQQLNPTSSSPSGGGGLLDGILGGGGNAPLDASQKRCLELGGTYDQCANSLMGAVSALGSLLFGGAGDTSSAPPPVSGIVLVGSYHSRADLPELALNTDGSATLQKCGTLVDASHTYTLRKSGATTQVVLDNEPNPIALTLRSDGSLSGPGNISVKGQIITGYNNISSCTTGTLAAKCTTTASIPIYGASMQSCTLSLLAAQPAPPPAAKPTGMVGQITDMLGAGDPVATLYGFRVTGPYASSNGMLLSFDNGFVTLDCGQAHVNAPYTVDNSANGFVVHVQNGGGAFLLSVAPDNTLRGSGSTTVNGRLVSAVNGQNISFTPHSETCKVGTFVPKGQRNTMVASTGPMPAVPTSSPTATPASAAAPPPAPAPIASALAGAGISATPSGTQAQLRVLLSTDFTGVNPLANQVVFVTREPMNQILGELGVAVPANSTPGQAMKALKTQCQTTQGCSSAIQGLSKYYVTTTKLDASGKATLTATAATGQYYFFAIVANGSGSTVWDLSANLAAGDNSVTFSQANSETVQ